MHKFWTTLLFVKRDGHFIQIDDLFSNKVSVCIWVYAFVYLMKSWIDMLI